MARLNKTTKILYNRTEAMLKSSTWNGLEKKALEIDVAVKLKLGNWKNKAKLN